MKRVSVTAWYDRHKQSIMANYWRVVCLGMLMASGITPMYAAATDIFSGFNTVVNDVYVKLLALTTSIAVLMLVIALLCRMSKNERTVQEANAWIKRIVISWAVINSLGWIFTYLGSIFTGVYKTTP